MDKQMLKEMTGAYIQACDSYSHDITGLYLKLEHIFDKYYKQGLAKEGEDFIFDLGLDITVRLKFYKDATEVYVDNTRNERIKEGLVVSKEQSWKKEYTTLKEWGKLMSITDTAIGKLPPDSLLETLVKMNPGTIFSFTEGKTYICQRNKQRELTFYEVFDGDIKNFNLESFCNKEPVKVKYASLIDLQRFYQQNRKKLTHTMETDYSVIDSAYVQIKNLEQDITPFRSKKVQLGPVSLIVKKSFTGNLRWYGADGKQIDKEKVAYLIGVLNTQPIVTTYNRQAPTELKTAEDAEFRLGIEKLLDTKSYRKAYREMLEYSLLHTDDLVINTDGFLRDGDNYIAGTITFRNGQAYKTTYENNDFSTAKESTPLTEDEFNTLCERKYTDTFQRIYSDTTENRMDEVLDQMPEEDALRFYEKYCTECPLTIFMNINTNISLYPNITDNLMIQCETVSEAILLRYIAKEQGYSEESGTSFGSISEHGNIYHFFRRTDNSLTCCDVTGATLNFIETYGPAVPFDEFFFDVSYDEMVEYGYDWQGMYGMTKERALALYDEDFLPVYKLYDDGTEAMVYDIEEIKHFDGFFGIDIEDFERYVDRLTTDQDKNRPLSM